MNDNPIFAVVERAAQLRAQGVDVITLAAGEPQAATAKVVVDAAIEAAQNPRAHHYGPAEGELALRTAIAERLGVETSQPWSADQVQVTLGAKHALYLAILAISPAADEILVAAPGWPGHSEAALAAGVTPVPVAVDDGFRLTAAALEVARTPRTRAVVLSSPGNPTGAVYCTDSLRAIADWAGRHRIWVISDDIYAAFDYTGTHRSILSVAPEHREYVVIVGAVSKEHAMTGWRVGWLAAPSVVVARARLHVARTVTHVPSVPQWAAVAALHDRRTPRQAARRYRSRRDRLVAALHRIEGIDASAPDGGMFVFADARTYLANHGYASGADLANWLLETAHIAVVPGEAFDAPGYLRFCFAVDDDTLDAAITRLTNAVGTEPAVRRREGSP